MIKMERILDEDLIGKILVCGGNVIEITSTGNEELFGRPFLGGDAEDYSDTDKYFNTDYATLLECGFTLLTKEEAAEVFKPFFDLKKDRVLL